MKKIYVVLLFILLVLFGCAQAQDSRQGGAIDGNNESNETVELNELNRKIYYVVNYNVSNSNIESTIDTISNKVTSLNGYIQSSTDSSDNDSYYIYRVPTTSLNEFLKFMNSIDGTSNRVINSSDITSAYSATDEKIKTLNASKIAYVKLLETPGLSMEEIILINDKIEFIDTELNILQNTKANYDNILDYSTINITFSLEKNEESFFEEYLGYIVGLIGVLFNVIMYLLPFVIIFFVVFYLVKAIKKHRNNKSLE